MIRLRLQQLLLVLSLAVGAADSQGQQNPVQAPPAGAAASGSTVASLAAAAAAATQLEPSAEAVARSARLSESRPKGGVWDYFRTKAEKIRGHRRWGAALDAGTGAESIKWIRALPAESVVAVTAAPWMVAKMKKNVGNELGEHVQVLVGNWLADGSDALAENPQARGPFDTVLADFLLGSIEHFSPFEEEGLLDRLLERLAPGGLLLFCGREPQPYPGPKRYAAKDHSPGRKILLDTERVRDAAMMLSHQRPYREFPQKWVEAALARKGLEVSPTKIFPMKLGPT